MTDELYADIIRNALAARIERTVAVGSIVINYRVDPLLQNKRNPKTIEQVEEKLKEILSKNPEPNRGLLEGLLAIKISYIGPPGVAPKLEKTGDIAEEFAEKRLTCNDQELKDWVLANLPRFDESTRDQIIFAEFEKALFKKAKEHK
jgi:hypothetical protein